MAQQQQKSNKGKPRTFVGGMVSDIDPRYQPENSYRYAKNLRLISKDGLSLSLENINGNLLSVDITIKDIVNIKLISSVFITTYNSFNINH